MQQESIQDLLSQADEVLQHMSELTGLPIKGPLKKQVISRPEVEKYITQNLHAEMTPAGDARPGSYAAGLRPGPAGLQPGEVSDQLLHRTGGGFLRSPAQDHVHRGLGGAGHAGLTLAHELTHALQDQNFDLEKLPARPARDDDATSARQAVVEGDATAAMMQQSAGGVDLGQLPDSPG